MQAKKNRDSKAASLIKRKKSATASGKKKAGGMFSWGKGKKK